MITRENYEIYFTDYWDGLLSPDIQKELQTFLLIHPDLEQLLEEIDNVRLVPSTQPFRDKKSLKKEASHECPDYYAIAAAEQTLTEEDKKVLCFRHQNNDFKTRVQTYENLKLKPDLHIRFENKSVLYRKSLRQILFFRSASAAAILLFITGVGLLISNQEKKTELLLAKTITIEPQALSIPAPKLTIEAVPIVQTIQAVQEQTKQMTPTKMTTPEEKVLEKPEIPVITTLPIGKVDYGPSKITIQVAGGTSPEIQLSKYAGEWKPSVSNFQTKDIFTSAIHAGKNIAERIKNKNSNTEDKQHL